MNLDELKITVDNFKTQVNANENVRKISKGWNVKILFWIKDLDSGILLDIKKGFIEQIIEVKDQTSGNIKVVGNCSIMYDMFSGNEKVTRLYMDGAIETYGPERDLIRLDAISAILWPD